MITKEQAVSATYRTEFHSRALSNADGSPVRCRVNGACKVWKSRPDEYKLPVKYGLKQCFYIDERNADQWYATAQEAIAAR